MSEFPLVELHSTTIQIIDGDRGVDYPKKTEFRKQGDCLFLDSSNLTKNGFDFSSKTFISKEVDTRMGKGRLQRGDLVMNTRGTIGNIGFYSDEVTFKSVRINSGMVIIRGGEDYDTRFLYLFLRSNMFFSQTKNLMSGSVQKQLPVSVIKYVKLPKVEISTQQKIAAVLSALDAKIELNARINATLESLAKTTFRYLFIDNKEKRNWEIGTLGDIAENVRRSANPSNVKPETPYIGLEHMPRKSISLSEFESANKVESNKYAFKTGEFLFGKLRPYFHKVGIAPVDGICSTDILVITAKVPEWYGFVLGHISSDEIIKYADATSGGTKMPRTNWGSLARFEILIPPAEKAKEFSEFLIPIAKQIRTNILESQRLRSLRDWLLPMLMNGQVSVKT